MEAYKLDGSLNERFQITNDRTALWAIEKIRERRAEADRFKAHYEAMARKVEDDLKHDVANLEYLLEAYFDTVPHKATKTQESYQLPGAKLIRKTQNPKFDRDEETLVEYLEANNRADLVKIKKSPDWAEYKKETTIMEDGTLVDVNTGEVVRGVSVTLLPPAFQVKLEGE